MQLRDLGKRDIAQNLPRTTGSVRRIEQCVCVSLGTANHAPQGGPHMSLDAKLKEAKIEKISRGTIMKRRAPAIGPRGARRGNCEPVEAGYR